MAVAKKHKVTVFHIVSDSNSEKKLEITHKVNKGLHTYIAYVKSTNNPFAKAYYFWLAFRELLQKESQFDMVHLNTLYPFGIFCLYLKWFKKLPFIISEHWTGYVTFSKFTFFRKRLTKLILKNSERFCPVSSDLRNNVFTKFKVAVASTIVPNVVDTNSFTPVHQASHQFTILHISNMKDSHKNVSGILRTIQEFAKLEKNFTFILMGENSHRYQEKATELGIENHIEFMNHMPHSEVPKIMNKANVFMLFSNYENLPCVILESFSCGVPVITTDVGGIKEFFPENFGKLIGVRDEQQLLDAIIHYRKQHMTQAQKSKMHEYVKENFSLEKVCDAFDNIYQEILQNNHTQ